MNQRDINSTALLRILVLQQIESDFSQHIDDLLIWLNHGAPEGDLTTRLKIHDVEPQQGVQRALKLLDKYLFAENNSALNILGFPDDTNTDAEESAVKLRYRRLIQAFHPDRHPELEQWLTERTERLNIAYKAIKNNEHLIKSKTASPSSPSSDSRSKANSHYSHVKNAYAQGESADVIPPSDALVFKLRYWLGAGSSFEKRFFTLLFLSCCSFLCYLYYANNTVPTHIPVIMPSDVVQSQANQSSIETNSHIPAISNDMAGQQNPLKDRDIQPTEISNRRAVRQPLKSQDKSVDKLESTEHKLSKLASISLNANTNTDADRKKATLITESPLDDLLNSEGAINFFPISTKNTLLSLQASDFVADSDHVYITTEQVDDSLPTTLAAIFADKVLAEEWLAQPESEKRQVAKIHVNKNTRESKQPATVVPKPVKKPVKTKKDTPKHDSKLPEQHNTVPKQSKPAVQVVKQAKPKPLPVKKVHKRCANVSNFIKRYTSHYNAGNVAAYVGLFAAGARENSIQGKTNLRQAYQDWFKHSDQRYLYISGLLWQPSGGGQCRVNGHYSVSYFNHAGQRKEKSGRIKFVLKETKKSYRIVSVQY